MQLRHQPDQRPRPTYLARSWVDPRLERRRSPIQGTGLFATAPIRRGEIVTIWGGTLFSDDELHAGIARPMSCVPIIDGLHLGSFKDQPESLDEFMNHSCDPNLWLQDEVTLVAMRDIAEDEEVTIDYALWETDPGWRMKCLCHSPRCRDWISGDDWRRSDVRQRYAGHFSPYVARRIRLVGAARDAA